MKCCLLFLTFSTICFAADWTINLEYSLNDFSTSSPLGTIELRRNYDGNYTGSFKSSQEKDFGKKLLEAKDQTYSVRAKSSTQPGQEFLTTSKACLLLRSNLFHLFWVSTNGQQLQTITVFPDPVASQNQIEDPENPQAPSKTCQLPSNHVTSGAPSGTVTVSTRGVLPTPDTASFVQRIEQEKRAKQHGADADNRSFLAKYWMYILPVVLFAFLSNAVNPENQEGGGQQ
ncbi:unnamed protein product [Caenorhabditis angaria]|uniref:ER membrane protein complex subunit 10 n=1 Tax=Caenorhabditis angaria TaxID=860376 RepID=A0A9P1ITC0_9PELO|nr:unnamed protein product [Caenorhabditis angaria]